MDIYQKFAISIMKFAIIDMEMQLSMDPYFKFMVRNSTSCIKTLQYLGFHGAQIY